MKTANFFEGEYPESNTSEKKVADILKKFSAEWTIFHSVNVHDPETEKITNMISNLNRPMMIVPIKVISEIFETKILNKIFLLKENIFLITTKK